MSDYSIDLEKNEKQKIYFYKVLESIRTRVFKYFAYGGAIRGGKTYVTLAILIVLCKIFKGSRWVVVRKDMPSLQKTTIPSFEKLIRGSSNWQWSRDKSNLHVTLISTGSKIFFYGENIDRDPELETFLGVECNGFFLEQIEELDEKMWQKAVERSGSWYIDNMPPPFIFTTFNPTQKWPKKKFYEPYINGELKPPYFFLEALPNDNPFVTKDQWDAWGTLDEINYNRFVKGDWNAFAITKAFAYAFRTDKHVKPCEYDAEHFVYLSFDFNRDPITCTARQYIDGQIRYIKAFRIKDSDIYELCDIILAAFNPLPVWIVTGDATGRASSALVKGKLNYWKVIREKLLLNDNQMKVPTINPAVSDTRVVCNSILQHFDMIIDPSLTFLIEDLMYCEVDENGDIDKAKDKHRTHLLDCWRYDLYNHFNHLITLPTEILEHEDTM